MTSIPPPRPGLRTGANMSDGDTSMLDEIDPRAMVPPAEDRALAAAMADVPDDDSLAMVQAMTLGEPIGNGALRELLAWGCFYGCQAAMAGEFSSVRWRLRVR